MLRSSRLVSLVALFALSGFILLLVGQALLVPSGQFATDTALSAARDGASAATLSDGRVLVSGGNDASGNPLGSVEFLGAGASAGSMITPRSGHISVALQDGTVLLAGGTTTGGAVTNSAEIFNPGTGASTAIASLLVARSGATATLLTDGRVLITGGQGSASALQTTEIYDPVAGQFSNGAPLSSPRQNHAAALLNDGRVAIAGGSSDGTNALNTIDIYDPVANSVSPFAATMAVARMGLSATTLMKGQVLLAGGTTSGSATATTEILDVTAGTITPGPSMSAARTGHLALLLPNNNAVLMASGASASAAAEIYIPWQNVFAPFGTLANPRTDAAGGASGQTGAASVAGGVVSGTASAVVETIHFPMVKTDKPDYQPGNTATITGSGFGQNETVNITLVESPDDGDGPHNLTATTDTTGAFSTTYPIDQSDLNVRFYLTAIGGTSGLTAGMTFTDASSKLLTFTFAGTGTGSVAVSDATTSADSATIQSTCVGGSCKASLGSNDTGTLTATASAGSVFAGWSAQSAGITGCSGSGCNFSMAGLQQSVTATFNTVTSQTISVDTPAPGSAAYGSSFNVAAHASSGLAVSVLASGGCSGSGTSTGSPGSAVSITMTSGTTACMVTYSQAGNGTYSAATNVTSSTSATPARVTVSGITANSRTYNGTNTATLNFGSALLSGVISADQSTVTLNTSGYGATFPSANQGTGLAVTVSGLTLNNNSAGNYSFTQPTGITANITAVTVTVTGITANSRPYNGANTATLNFGSASLSGVISADQSTVTLNTSGYGATFPNANQGTGLAVTVSGLTLNNNSAGNYSFTQPTGITANITAATVTVTGITANSRPYNGANTATLNFGSASLSGVISADQSTVTLNTSGYSATFPSANQGTGLTVTVSGLTLNNNSAGNYSFTQPTGITANITLAPVTATAGVYSGTYDGNTHSPSACVVSGVYTGTLTCTNNPTPVGPNVGSGTVTPSVVGDTTNFSVTPANGSWSITSATPVLPVTQTESSTYGTSETLKVTITAVAGGEAPTGTVQFQFTNPVTSVVYNVCSDGSLQAQTPTPATPCVVTLAAVTPATSPATSAVTVTTTSLPAGVTADAVTATYVPGDSNYSGGTATIDYTVNMASTLATLNITSSTTTPPTYGDPVTLSTVVSDNTTNSTGIPTGTVQFQFTNGSNTYNVCSDGSLQAQSPVPATPCSVTLVVNMADTAAIAQTITTWLPAGTDTVKVIYSGDSNFAGTSSGTTAYPVNQKTLNITGITASNKPYDGTTTATLNTTGETLNGVISPDAVTLAGTATGAFTSANAGTGITVNITGLSLTGTAANNYTLPSPVQATTTANITQVQLTVTASSPTVTYGDPVPSITANITGFVNNEGTSALSTQPNCTTTYTVGSNAGSTQTTSCSGGAATNYSFKYVPGTVTVNQAHATIVVTPYSVTYDTTAHTATGTATGVGGANLNADLTLSGTTHTNAGTYGADPWSFTDPAGNYMSANGTVSDLIKQANATIVVTPYSVTYDTTAHTATGTATGVGGANLNADLTLSGTTHTNAGTYGADPWSFTDPAGNYMSANGTVSDLIKQANATIVVTPYSVTYDATAHTATGTATGIGGANLNADLTLSGTTHTNAGTYAADPWSFHDPGGNYADAGGTVSDLIKQANATIVVTPYSVTYDATAHTATGTATGVGGANLNADLTLSGTTHTNAGTYGADPWSFTDPAGNYMSANGTVSDLIKQANATIVVTPYSVTYDATAHTATGTATGIGGANLNADLTLSGTTHTNAGTYAADPWSFHDPGGNYADAGGTVSDLIKQANATIVVTPYSVTYDATAHTATGTATGVGGANLNADLTLSGTTHTNAGTYGADPWSFTDPAGNYMSANGTVSDLIKQANATIVVTPYSVTYDATAHTATGTATGIGGANLNADLTLSGTTHTNAGTYAADPWSFHDPGGNYADAGGTVSDLIKQANATIVVTPYSVTYDTTAHTATGTATGVGGANLNADLTLSGTTHTNAGTYGADPWSFHDPGGNYADASGTVSDLIKQANATIVVTPYSVTYDTTAHTATGTATGVGGANLNADLTLSGTTHTNAGTYGADPWSFTDPAGNYMSANGTVSDVIGQATAAIAVTPYNVTYDGNPHTATGTATGVGSANLSADLNLGGTTHTNAGTYATDAWTFTDPAGNYKSANGTVSDVIQQAPSTTTVTGGTFTYDATAHAAAVMVKGAGGLSLTPSPSYSGTCSSAPITVAQGTSCTASYTYPGDANHTGSSGSATITITKAATTVTSVTVTPATQQYSDLVTLSATLASAPPIGGNLSFYINYGTGTQQLLGTTAAAPNSTDTVSGVALLETVAGSMAPGAHTITAVFTPTDTSDFLGSSNTASLTITQEDAKSTYTGPTSYNTACPTCTSTVVPLSATVQDITAIDPAADPNPGNILNAHVIFYDTVSNTTLCTATLSLVNPGDSKTANATCSFTANITGSGPSTTYSISVLVGRGGPTDGYYVCGKNAETPCDIGEPLVVMEPSATSFVTGGGYIVLADPAGAVPGNPGTHNNFGFGIHYNKSGSALQGHFNAVYRSSVVASGDTCPAGADGLHIYQIDSTSLNAPGESLSVQLNGKGAGGTATLFAKGTLTDVTNPLAQCIITDNAQLQVGMFDSGLPTGQLPTDTISISLTPNGGGTALYISDWTGKVVEDPLKGNIAVH